MFSRRPRFFVVVWFSSSPTPIPISKLDQQNIENWEKVTTNWRGGEGRSQIIQRQESLILYTSFNTLWGNLLLFQLTEQRATWTQSRQRADGNGKKDPIRKEGSGAGSGSVHQTNGSRSGRPKTCRSGSGFPTPPIRSHLILYRSELPVATAHAHIWPWHHELPRQGGGQTGRGCREQWAAGIPTHPPYLTNTNNRIPSADLTNGTENKV